tara:strand:- start:1308 stop:2303 length:996 start_codon:yes stop_codon:yes gene_type:complete
MTQKIRFYNYADSDDIKLSLSILQDEDLPQIKKASKGYSFEQKPEKPFDISFKILVNRDIFTNVVPSTRHEDEADYEFCISYSSSASRKRDVLKLSKSNDTTLNNDLPFQGLITIDPSEWFGSINFQAIVVRNKLIARERGYLTDKYSIVGSSDDHNIYIEPLEKFDGSQIEMADGQIRRDGALYELIQSSPPRLIINEEAPEFTLKMLRYRSRDNSRRAFVRDALFAPIIVDVWEQLARVAIHKMLPEDSDDADIMDPKLITFPYNNIVQLIAKKLYGGTQEDANAALIGQLENPIGRAEMINEILPVVVQEIGELNKYYERLASKYWRE